MKKLLLYLLIALLTVSCAKRNVKPVLKPSPPSAQSCQCQATEQPPVQLPDGAKSTDTHSTETKPIEAAKIADFSLLKPARWEDIDGFQQDDLSAGWDAWQKNCTTLINKPQWQSVCAVAKNMAKPSNASIIAYLTNHFDVYATTNQDGTSTGLITGYFQPTLKGSRTKSAQFPHPLYRQPNDLIAVELADIYPDLKYKRVRGKLQGNKLVSYSTRAEIEVNPSPLAGSEIFWVEDIIDVFFLQVQGSGIVSLENGDQVQVGYAEQNGHAYNSIGRLLVERGELNASQASMQGIKNWARNNLGKLRDLLNSNPSYVFFRELPTGLPGPIGALGVPIATERSVAIDPKFIPLGAPLFLSTTQPNSAKPLKRLMMAQDTGGAIKGGVRADYFWGAGVDAGAKAGAMKQQGKIWVMLPKGYQFSQ